MSVCGKRVRLRWCFFAACGAQNYFTRALPALFTSENTLANTCARVRGAHGVNNGRFQMAIPKTTKPPLLGEGFEGVSSLHDAGGGDTNSGIVARRPKPGKRRHTTTTVGGRRRPRGDQRKSQRLVDYDGKHKGPMHYIVRLAQPEHEDAWLFVYVDGEPSMATAVPSQRRLRAARVCRGTVARRRASAFGAGALVGRKPRLKNARQDDDRNALRRGAGSLCGHHDGASDAPSRVVDTRMAGR